MTQTPDEMAAEFDTVAAWTADVVERLGSDYALAAGCRGSGSPAALAWLCEAMQLAEGTSLVDVGAGVGGPGAFAAQRYGAVPVLTDPMPEAAAASRRLFGLPAVVAEGQRLPFRSSSFDSGWALGVLCTTEAKRQLLSETRRVLKPQGRLGLLVLLRTVATLPDQPAGNSFPDEQEVHALLPAAGFQLLEQADTSDFPAAPVAWQAKVDRVEAAIAEEHAHDEAWQVAQQQSELIGRLLEDGLLRTVLLHAVAV